MNKKSLLVLLLLPIFMVSCHKEPINNESISNSLEPNDTVIFTDSIPFSIEDESSTEEVSSEIESSQEESSSVDEDNSEESDSLSWTGWR